MPALRVEGVSVRFGGLAALHEVDLVAEGGTVTGLIGPNGAGKTTLFNVITGLQPPTTGRVLLDGEDVTRAKPHRRARRGMARTFQRLEVFGSLTARENIMVAAEARRSLRRRERPDVVADAVLARIGLTDVADQPVDAMPTGHARLVELGRALATDPIVLLLDEPGSGLDEGESAFLGDLLVELAASGIAVLLVEHDVDLVMRVCHAITVLDFGHVIARGAPAAIREDPAVQAAYLGEELDDHLVGERTPS